MAGGRELDWDDDDASQIYRTAAQASPFADAWDDRSDLDLEVEPTSVGIRPEMPATESTTAIPEGSVVADRYVIEGELGKGAMGIVYAAAHMSTGQRVALKYLDPTAATSPASVKRFFRESQIAGLVKHPNIVEVLDGGRFGPSYFLVMERLEGRTLQDAIQSEQLEIVPLVELFLKIMDGVAAVHERGVVHRDLKPDNVYLTAGEGLGHPKVLDFGVSKLKQPDASAAKLTMAGMVMGTPHYMAPEQFADSGNVDQRADVYSLGVMLYEALTGKIPYEGEGVLSIYRQASEGKPTPIRAHRPDVPRGLEAIVKRAMSPDAKNRYPTVQAMREALASLAKDGTSTGWAPIEVEPTRAMTGVPGDPFVPPASSGRVHSPESFADTVADDVMSPFANGADPTKKPTGWSALAPTHQKLVLAAIAVGFASLLGLTLLLYLLLG